MRALSQSRAARAGFVVCSDVPLAAAWACVLWPWNSGTCFVSFGLGRCWREISITRRPCCNLGTWLAHTDTVLVLSQLGSETRLLSLESSDRESLRQFAGAAVRDRDQGPGPRRAQAGCGTSEFRLIGENADNCTGGTSRRQFGCWAAHEGELCVRVSRSYCRARSWSWANEWQ